ncbi:MAG: hypothetical protein Ct9H300mP23_04550 [Nitrospinota bacterium]|nr:MAG: hypothetical protein Ct9H300mP23_04550 [Nitrospinota bacterium]
MPVNHCFRLKCSLLHVKSVTVLRGTDWGKWRKVEPSAKKLHMQGNHENYFRRSVILDHSQRFPGQESLHSKTEGSRNLVDCSLLRKLSNQNAKAKSI